MIIFISFVIIFSFNFPFLFFLFVLLFFSFLSTELKFLTSILWDQIGMKRKWKQKSEVDKYHRKRAHMIDLWPVKRIKIGSLINGECIHGGITYLILFSALYFSFLIILFPLSNFRLILQPSDGVKIDLYFRCLISVYSSSHFPSSDIRVNSLISLVQCLWRQTSWVTYNFSSSSDLFPSRMISITIIILVSITLLTLCLFEACTAVCHLLL